MGVFWIVFESFYVKFIKCLFLYILYGKLKFIVYYLVVKLFYRIVGMMYFKLGMNFYLEEDLNVGFLELFLFVDCVR